MPPLVDRKGKLVWSVDEKASMFSAYFDAKQCRESFLQPYFCGPFSVMCSVAFWSSFVRSLLLDLDSYGGFHFFISRWLATKLAVILRHLIKRGSFSACWRLADGVSTSKESPSFDVGGYRPISITPFLQKIFEKIVAGPLSHFLKSDSLLHPQFSYHGGLGPCVALLTLSHHLQVALDMGMGQGWYLSFIKVLPRVKQGLDKTGKN